MLRHEQHAIEDGKIHVRQLCVRQCALINIHRKNWVRNFRLADDLNNFAVPSILECATIRFLFESDCGGWAGAVSVALDDIPL